VKRTEAIIYSMTPQERARPEMIDGSRRIRISKGSGTTVADVNRLVKQFSEMKKMMKQMGGKGMLGGKRGKAAKSAGMPDDLAAALGSRLGPR
jgi:signal recognition particle subunit SRP54